MFQIRNHPAYPYLVRLLFIGLMLLLVFLAIRIQRIGEYGSPGTNDLIAYWTAGKLLRARESPYDANKLYQLQLELGYPRSEPVRMWNPPWLLVWIFPLFLLSFPGAAIVWGVVNFGLILGCGMLVWRALTGLSTNDQIGTTWIASVAFVPTLFTLRMGQVSTIVLLGVAGFLYFAPRNRDFLAGMCLALTTAKPHVGYLLWIAVAWWIFKERRWKTVVGMASLLLPTIMVLTSIWPGWLSGYQTIVAQPPLSYATPTLGSILRLLISPNASQIQFLPSLVVGSSLLGYLIIKQPVLNWKAAMSPLLLISVSTAAYGWSFDQIVLLVPFIEIIVWLTRGHISSHTQKATLLASLLLIGAVMVTQNLLKVNELFFFWMPWALGGIYAYARAIRSMGEKPFLQMAKAASVNSDL